MPGEYRIPKRQVPAHVTLVGEPTQELHLFVGQYAESHEGGERPGDVLNGRESYVPALDAQGGTRLLNLDAVLVVTVTARDEGVLGALEFQAADAACVDVVVALEGGLHLRGVVRYVLPEGQQRLQNYLRQPERFLPLYDGPRLHWINRRRVVWVESRGVEGMQADMALGASAPRRS